MPWPSSPAMPSRTGLSYDHPETPDSYQPSGGGSSGGGSMFYDADGKWRGPAAFFFGGSKPSTPGWDLESLHKKYVGAMNEEERSGLDAESYGYDKAKAFDPAAAFATFTKGATDAAGQSLDLQLKKLAGASVGSGRLDTGFYDQDQGDVVRSVYGDLNNTLASKALDVTGMEQQQDQYLANYGTERRNRYLDLLSGGLDRKYAELHPPQAPNSGGGFWSSLLSAGATLGAAAIVA